MGQKMEANFPNSSLKLPSLSSSLKRKRPPMIAIPTVLQEISSQTPKFRDPLTAGDGGVISSSGLSVCVSAVKGKKKFMEDSHKIVSCLNGCSRNGFFGVYDGHGGKKAAEFAAENLHSNIMAIMDGCGNDFTAKEEAVKAGYLKTDQQFLEQGLLSGACCVTALIEGEEVVVSNLGDCRAVLCRGGVAEALTTDHRAEREDERERIENEGGYVEIHRGAWRVHGILSVSRSIGDAHLKQWVSAEPDTKIMQLKPDMDYLVLASDGLWEVVGNQEAIDIVTKLCMPDEIEFGCVNVSPSSKLRRVSLVKQKQSLQKQSPHKKTTENCCKDDGFPTENDAPPLKSRRINLVKKINMKIESPDKENTKIIESELASATKELVNLAVSRGSLDDITVMIIDLSYFRSKQAI
ncbi:Probable protein phosphatase 2C 14 [Linum perenne]